jgi:Holliday junction resolvase RusA-like endonuclease
LPRYRHIQHTFTIPGVPVAKARARVVDGRAYTPEKTRAAESEVQFYATASHVPLIESGPIWLALVFVFPWPKSWPKKRRPQFHTVKPDASNLLKLVEDALNGICWRDDSQVCVVHADKRYGETPETVVRYGSLTEEGLP